MNTVKLIQICLLAACLSNQMHDDVFEMAGMRRAIETATKEHYKVKPFDAGFTLAAAD